MTHVVTVWWRRGGGYTRLKFKAPHVRSVPLGGRRWQIELCDKKWRVFGVEQLRADRVSIRRKR